MQSIAKSGPQLLVASRCYNDCTRTIRSQPAFEIPLMSVLAPAGAGLLLVDPDPVADRIRLALVIAVVAMQNLSKP